MAGLIPYLLFPGSAAEALSFYASVFGGETRLFTYAEAGRADGPGDAIAHGMLDGPIELAAADAAAGESTVSMNGMFFSLLGAAEPETPAAWFDALAEGGSIIDPLQKRPWGDHDGTLVDRFGVPWLIGYQG
ncbi:VOC family protein [Microbacterium sp. OR16]|uniref:VOC family protein n=1 Tax=Microbacterium sp. OR16 TaxID=3095345 RepID=UPI0039B64981